jgi:hydrogenase maturation factor
VTATRREGRLVSTPNEPHVCLTCADEAVAARVLAVDGLEASVEVAPQVEHVAIDLVPDALPGELLLCHAGIALERIDEAR